jgi:hypothetical protein
MQRKLIGYLKDGLDRHNYLSIEIPVFESGEKDKGALQIVDKKTGFITGFDDIPGEFIELLPPEYLLKPAIASKEKECIYLAKYNNKFFAEPKSSFISKLSRWLHNKERTYLNQFSLFLLFNIRYKAFWAASEVIERNELNLKKLSIQNFSIPAPLSIHNSTLTLREIILFYAKLTLDENAQLDFEWLFESSPLDTETLTLNQGNILVMGNYFAEVNKFLSDLISLNTTLEYSGDDELVRRYQRCFLVVFGKLQANQLVPGQLTERFEEEDIPVSRQASLLVFNPQMVTALIDSLKIDWIKGQKPSNYRACAELEYFLF